jgi:hypothetical protein
MRLRVRALTASVGLALLAAFLLGGPQSAVSRPRKPAELQAPDPPPPVGLSSRIINEATAYHGYVAGAAAITPAFSDGASVARSLRVGVAYQPEQLFRGAVAYGALAAMQDRTFMATVRVYAADATMRTRIAQQLKVDPAYAALFRGADSAAGLVVSALGADGIALFTAGKAVKQSAYDVQHDDWSKGEVADRQARLADTKFLSATPPLDAMERARLTEAANRGVSLGLSGAPVAPPYTPTVIRALAVAALAALGEADDAHIYEVMPLLTAPYSGTCLSMAKLNLYQCLAVSKPHYEDIFCLGQHAMMDTGQCLIQNSGIAVPPDLLPKPVPIAVPEPEVTASPVKSAKPAKSPTASKAPAKAPAKPTKSKAKSKK